jgi:carotenoid cleavage dioxygenase
MPRSSVTIEMAGNLEDFVTKEFPDSAQLAGWEAPLRFEGDIYDLEIIGEVPADLDGTFFRQRYVHTDRYLAERAARQSLFGAYRNPFTEDPSVTGLSRGTANTNMVVHNGTLWALKEDSLPIAMDPVTLETRGPSDFDGAISSRTFTAHPKIDPRTGELICFGYAAKGETTADIAYYVIGVDGKVRREVWFEAPHAAMIHDMAVTENYVIFPVMPLTSDIDRLKAGGPHFQWQPTLDIVFGVLPREGKATDVRWFRAPNGFPGHVLNAHEVGGRIFLDVPLTQGNVFYWWPSAGDEVTDPGMLPAKIARIVLDPRRKNQEAEVTQLFGVTAEFPHIDNRYATVEYQHAFLSGIDPHSPLDLSRAIGQPVNTVFNALLHLDIHSGRVRSWAPGISDTVQEPVFVPRGPNAAEGEGFILQLINRLAESRSDLVVLDSTRIPEGPIATIRLPFRMKNGLHGNWASAAELAETP